MLARLLVLALALTAGLSGVASQPAEGSRVGSIDRVGPSGPLTDDATDRAGTTETATVDAIDRLGPNATDADTHASEIVGVYPDPVPDEDRGEFVVVDLEQDGPWTLSDGEGRLSVPAVAVGRGPVALAADPEVAEAVTDLPVIETADGLALSNAGERVVLERDGAPVDGLAYPDGPTAEYWDGERWRVPGRTALRPLAVRDVPVEAFVLPDEPAPVLESLRAADDRILLAGYTFSSPRVARALRTAAARGVDVRVLVEGGPVGGVSEEQAAVLDSLVRADVPVTAIDGPRARYPYHHAKYAVVDDRALVTSENWKPSGVGGRSSRGWGVVVSSPRLADYLVRTFEADSTWLDGRPWTGRGRNLELQAPSEATFPRRFAPRFAHAEEVRVILAPDNADRSVGRLVRSANESLFVEQVRIEPGHPFLDASVAAARRGVDVRVLLSGAWYVREENRNLTRRLNRLAAAEGLPLEARVVRPRSRFEKIHVKGVVVDGERALVGSLNWNTNAVEENREVALLVRGDRVGDYYERVFLADWHGGAWRISVGVLLAVLAAVIGVALAGRRIEFENGRGDG